MLLILACVIASAAAAPAIYDQRQDGELNVLADVQNVVFLIAYPKRMNYLSEFFKSNKRHGEDQLQDRADFQVMEAFVEPNTPYRVEIGATEERRDSAADGRAVEVVISGRRRSETEPQAERDEMKLLGATEQCGPDRERDPITLTCRLRSQLPIAEPEEGKDKEDKADAKPAPEVVPS